MGKSEALAILSDIQAATFKNAAQLPLKESAQPEWQGIGFQIGGIRLVSPMGEVDEILQTDNQARKVIREAHPEVMFWGLNRGRPLAFSKKAAAGEDERLEILGRVYPPAKALFFEMKRTLPGKTSGISTVIILQSIVMCQVFWHVFTVILLRMKKCCLFDDGKVVVIN